MDEERHPCPCNSSCPAEVVSVLHCALLSATEKPLRRTSSISVLFSSFRPASKAVAGKGRRFRGFFSLPALSSSSSARGRSNMEPDSVQKARERSRSAHPRRGGPPGWLWGLGKIGEETAPSGK